MPCAMLKSEYDTFKMTTDSIDTFIAAEENRGISEKSYTRTRGYLLTFYSFLPDGKQITPEVLQMWRAHLADKGNSSRTITNYSRAINQYLRFYELDSLCYTRGHSYDLTGQTFGYLTVIEKVGKKDRNDNYWLCRCKCGNTVEVMATQLVRGTAKSCGCLQIEKLQRGNKYIAGTQLNAFIGTDDELLSKRGNASGYRNIYYQKGKWVVRIVYKGKPHYFGSYYRLDDAIKARNRAMQDIVEDARHLLHIYEQLHSSDDPLPSNKCVKNEY